MTNSNQNNENLPKILYKYLPLKDLTHFYYRGANINAMPTENMIFFPDYRKLNDPKEGNNCNIILNKKTIDKQENEHPLIKYLKLKYRILSLTKDCFNESMWDRYAGGYNSFNKTYEGICIGFKTNGEFNKAKKIGEFNKAKKIGEFNKAKKIEYVNKPKVKNITEEFDKLKKYFEKDDISYEDKEYENLIKPLKEKIEESFFYKDEYWEKEEEYRIVDERSFFIADPKKQLELEFELIKCIFKKNNLEELIKNISEFETTLKLNIDIKEGKPICPYENLKKFYNIIYDKNKNSNEVINKIIEEIYEINENYRKKEIKYYNDDLFKYSREEIVCLITGCDLEKKFTEIDKKNIEHTQKCRDNFKNSFTKIFEKQKIEIKKLIDKKQIEEISEKIDKLLNSNENNNNNYLKMLKNITDTMKDFYKNYYKKGNYNSYGIFIPFYRCIVGYKNKYEELQTHSPVTNFDLDTISIQLFYMHELNLKSQIIEIYGDEEIVNKKILPDLPNSFEKHLILYYYKFILIYGYSQFSDFFNEKFSGKDIKDIEIKVKNIENYKNNPEELEKDMKDFYKNHPEKLENIEEYSKEIAKSINVLSKYEPTCEPENDDPPSAFYFTFFISSYYNLLNHFFNKQLEELKELNKEFYENFKNIKFYKTIIGNGQIQLNNCITGKIIKNQEELEKDIENQEEPEQNQNKKTEIPLVKN